MPKRTPLHDEHIRLSAKMVEFAGWEMPIQYTGVMEEHRAVRNAAGIFDVSHMGRFEVTGAGATEYVQHLTTNDMSKLVDGMAQYSLLCNDRGTILDDIIVYRLTKERYLLVVNAINEAKDFNWCQRHAGANVTISDVTESEAMIAIQGPRAAKILQGLTDIDLASLPHFCFRTGTVAGIANCVLARTGYTGEDGFEIFVPSDSAIPVWRSIMERGKDQGLMPVGLGARDTLRMEMKYSLYEHEISEDINPLEAGLSWVVKLNAGDFIGRDALLAIKEKGLKRKLVGFQMIDNGIPRQGYHILVDGKPVGVVTSGTMSPSLNKPIGIGFVPADAASAGNKIYIDIRGRARLAEIVKTPFYKRSETNFQRARSHGHTG
jgi:aminomethyltransferase